MCLGYALSVPARCPAENIREASGVWKGTLEAESLETSVQGVPLKHGKGEQAKDDSGEAWKEEPIKMQKPRHPSTNVIR